MGAWGAGSFENDAAADWADALLRSTDATVIVEALAAVNESPGSSDSDDASAAIAAAEAVAALCGQPSPELPEQLAIWVHEHAEVLTPELPQLAAGAMARIKTDSELRDLWAEGDVGAWLEAVANLEYRLRTAVTTPTENFPPTDPAPTPPIRLVRRAIEKGLPPVLSPSTLPVEAVAALRMEYKRLKAARTRWRLLSLVLGGGGIAIILFMAPGERNAHPFGGREAGLTMAALVMFALGLMFAGKAKGRGLLWGFTALGHVRLFRRAAERDLMTDRLEELKRALKAHGEKM